MFAQMMFQVLAFRDITPQGPVHILLIPKVRDGLTGLSKVHISLYTSNKIQTEVK